MAVAHVKSNARHGLRLHPLPVRIMHWINAAAMIIMIMSGWKIYNDDVIFNWLRFPDEITLGKWNNAGNGNVFRSAQAMGGDAVAERAAKFRSRAALR